MSSIVIENLSLHPEWVELIAQWQYGEWTHSGVAQANVSGDEVSQISVKSCTEKFRQHLGFESIPSTFVAIIDEQPVGSISLVRYQTAKKNDIVLTNFFVLGAYRGKGIGRQLESFACRYAGENQIGVLTLYAQNLGGLYRHLGWAEKGVVEIGCLPFSVFTKNIHSL
ncbi:GNAT family N-acetyltransferase [Teredinibacter sp. KSP-S5-2]|uniref:GNAT family N-acetyltransferase n=1 Tax=Teredinibacter sp. KSP-S5-2 TaxID=3034506 RepID=UPI002934AC9B|nr:GNAT family N-acetyltransferase [Teredinibacter sp. KSP-S5-2]WNO09512.1 GNAT family N-acetyltransferase [Teredinibacter sp. KSP-S5-2]